MTLGFSDSRYLLRLAELRASRIPGATSRGHLVALLQAWDLDSLRDLPPHRVDEFAAALVDPRPCFPDLPLDRGPYVLA